MKEREGEKETLQVFGFFLFFCSSLAPQAHRPRGRARSGGWRSTSAAQRSARRRGPSRRTRGQRKARARARAEGKGRTLRFEKEGGVNFTPKSRRKRKKLFFVSSFFRFRLCNFSPPSLSSLSLLHPELALSSTSPSQTPPRGTSPQRTSGSRRWPPRPRV